MNLVDYAWANNNIYYEVKEASDKEQYCKVRAREMFNGGDDWSEIFLTVEIVDRIQKEILNTIDELGYFYEHQDREEMGEAIESLVKLQRMLTEDENPS